MADAVEAAGFVLACKAEGEPRYLLLRNARHGTWGFPKGHCDPGETPRQAARRETLEETGIDELEIIDGFERADEYEVEAPGGRRLKRVWYFLALTPRATHVQSGEHDDSGWFTLHEALARLQHEQLRSVLSNADKFLRSRS
jgi:8-oxo-dGTP pyrophosphatase MutT (NUDIX family)